MDRADWFLIALAAGLVLLSFAAVSSFAPEMEEVVLREGGQGQPVGTTFVKSLVSGAVLLFAGYPFSRIVFDSEGFQEVFFTSVMFSLLAYGWLTIMGVLLAGPMRFYSLEQGYVLVFLIAASTLGYSTLIYRRWRS